MNVKMNGSWKIHHAAGNVVDGKKIRQLREERGWTPAQFASMCELSTNNLTRIENGEGNTSTGKVRSMADALGVHPAELITGLDELIGNEIGHLRDLTIAAEERAKTQVSSTRDIALLRVFAGDEPAFLQIGTMKTDLPEEVLGDILHIVAVYRLKQSAS